MKQFARRTILAAPLPASSSTRPAVSFLGAVTNQCANFGLHLRLKQKKNAQDRRAEHLKDGKPFYQSWPLTETELKEKAREQRQKKLVTGQSGGIFADQGRRGASPRELVSPRLDQLAIPESVKQNLIGLGIRSLTEIQRSAFLPILRGRNFVGRAKTGTGKTAAYLIPIFERMRVERISDPGSVLILVPTRELCKQVGSMALSINPSADLVLLYSGDISSGQDELLRTGANVIVATPHRLYEKVKAGLINIEKVKIVVVDEVDAMLMRTYEGKLKTLLNQVPKAAQTALFSASMPPEVGKLIEDHFGKDFVKDTIVCDLVTTKTPAKHANSPATVVSTGKMDHILYKVKSTDLNERVRSAVHILHAFHRERGGREELPRTMLFVEKSADAKRVSTHPVFDRTSKCFHSDMPQHKREAVLDGFTAHKFPVLICTDIAARGLDVLDVEIVIQLHPPKEPMTYVHRAGRTGRAGKSGTCATLFSGDEKKHIDSIKKSESVPFRTEALPGDQELHTASVTRLLENLHDVPLEQSDVCLARAERMIQELGAAPLAAAMAILDGRASTFKSRTAETFSLLGGKRGFVTIMFSDPGGDKIPTKGKLYEMFAKYMPSMWKNKIKAVGQVHLATGGYIADVHSLYADELLFGNTKGIFKSEVGVEPIVVTQMPRLLKEKREKTKLRKTPWARMQARSRGVRGYGAKGATGNHTTKQQYKSHLRSSES